MFLVALAFVVQDPPVPKQVAADRPIIERIQAIEEAIKSRPDYGPALEVIRRELAEAKAERTKPFDYGPIREAIQNLADCIPNYSDEIRSIRDKLTELKNQRAESLARFDDLKETLGKLERLGTIEDRIKGIGEQLSTLRDIESRLGGLSGLLDEVREARKQSEEMATELRKSGGIGGVIAAIAEARAEVIKARAELDEAKAELVKVQGTFAQRFFWGCVCICGGLAVILATGLIFFAVIASKVSKLYALLPK